MHPTHNLPCVAFRLAAALGLAAAGRAQPAPSDGLLTIDPRSLVAAADLHYPRAAERSEAGLPIGNGRMGTLLWTTPSALRLQINRVDVFAIGSASRSFPERHTDYCGGCGFVDVDFSAASSAVFPAEATTSHLSCYDAQATIVGRGITVRVLAWTKQDVIALEVEDRREQPDVIAINLRMLRPPQVRTRSHLATSKLDTRGPRHALTQQFTEEEYHCGSAVVVSVLDRAGWTRQVYDEELRLIVPAGRGAFTVLIASAASFDRSVDLPAAADRQLDAATAVGWSGLAETSAAWWREFWAKSFIDLHSADGVADSLARHFSYYLYLMGASSRGQFPTKFNGMLWTTGGDRRQWGGQFWGANQSCLYNNALLAADHAELLEPMFDMYAAMAGSLAVAARQQWGSAGIFIPETVAFDGLAPLPNDVAAEMRDLYLLRKPWAARSTRFLEHAVGRLPFSSRWNWIGPGKWIQGQWVFEERGGGPFGPVTHIFSRGAKIAYQYWLRYEYTRDEKWLRDRAYPMLRGVAEFYRNLPNLQQEADGRYHIHHVNSNEPLWGGQDTDEEISALLGLLPVAIKAAEILQVDAELRRSWRELRDHLAPLPRSDFPGVTVVNPRSGPPVWIKGLEPAVRGRAAGLPDGNTMPMWFFELCALESEPQLLQTANATFAAFFPSGFAGRRVGVLSKLPLAAAILGRADAVRALLPNQLDQPEASALANRMDLREGPQTTSAQRLGNVADALHTALCQDLPSGPGQPPVIRVFAAWPREWDAAFALRCRGGFMVSSSLQAGRIEFVEIRSPLGGECRLSNPWGDGTAAAIYRNGRNTGPRHEALLILATSPGEVLVVVRAGTAPDQFRRTLPASAARRLGTTRP